MPIWAFNVIEWWDLHVRGRLVYKIFVYLWVIAFLKLTSDYLQNLNSTTLMMMMKMNCFCGMADRQKAFRLISSWDLCQRSSSLWISDTPRAVFEPAQNQSSGFVEWSCTVVITTTSRRHSKSFNSRLYFHCVVRVKKLYAI